MFPLHQANETRTAVLEYIKATFRFRDKEVNDRFHSFVADEHNGLFRGPYISLKTPFVKACNAEIPLEIKPTFNPHLHQIKAFQRLTTEDWHNPEPTLLTTGTGSGKTECFLYPVLDYVWRLNRYGIRKGVKVIIMYPMNALATDQAKRLAETIYDDERLRGVVTAGLFIGEGNRSELSTSMSRERVIEQRDAIVNTVPDILLTNFKMLDYGLMQQRYMPLWEGNLGDETMLRFLVLDELHTYDGAQGTDVANLIRRLKLKLNMPTGHLVPVGTSATMGSGAEAVELLTEYATAVFGETFTRDSVITEERLSPESFFNLASGSSIDEGEPVEESIRDLDPYIPSKEILSEIDSAKFDSVERYISRIEYAWLKSSDLSPVEIAEGLRGLKVVADMVGVTSKGILTVGDLIRSLAREHSGFARVWRENPRGAYIVIESLLALISLAKVDANGYLVPWLNLQVQLWQRELSGIQRIVQNEVEFTWRDAVPVDERIALPMWFCRDCGSSGWFSMKRQTEDRFVTDARRIGRAMVDNDRDLVLLNTEGDSHVPIPDYTGGGSSMDVTYYVRKEDLTIGSRTDAGAIKLRVMSRITETKGGAVPKFANFCPCCMAQEVAVVGQRTSTLSSVGVSQIMSSDYDGNSGRKMLCFTNSVQDAAHLAGFYELRTFRFLFRQSLQQYIKTLSGPVSLTELQAGFKEYWKERLKEGDEYYFRFLTDDVSQKVNLRINYRNPDGHPAAGELSESFKEEFDTRVDWEICSEFGMMSQLGRTLEKMGASATFFERSVLEKVFGMMEEWLKMNNLGDLVNDEDRFVRFVNGILHRMRQRGAVDHEYLRLYRTEKLEPYSLNWGKRKKEHFLHKSFGGNRIPRMIGLVSVKGKEVLDVVRMTGNRQNWFYRYFVKSFVSLDPLKNVYPELVNDFYSELIRCLTVVGILDKQVAGDKENYALRPEAIMISNGVREIKCTNCERRMYVSKFDEITDDTSCLDFRCSGRYGVPQPVEINYYSRIYNRELSPRIHSHEHTGLLERETREAIEQEFKTKTTPDAINVLTATSTLEMGIDIGDLNIVGLVGIPPKPSNFQQRVGRGGRKTGSALILNYAKSEKHDMFYFAEPLEMMQGAVSTPGCFLEATDILRRHFYAYCIDSWTSADRNNRLVAKIEYLPLNPNYVTDREFVINKIGEYIEANLNRLKSDFRRQYPESVDPVLELLYRSVSEGSFALRIMGEFERLISRRIKIKEEKNAVKKQIDTTPKNDKEKLSILTDRFYALRRIEKSINSETLVEFMTNQGLLPNYAFPETGVALSATVFARRPLGDEGETSQEPRSVELIRPASQGIRELAPGNLFYTQKLCLPIDGLSVSDDNKKQMRYCSRCDAIAEEGSDEFNQTTCPKCQSDSWRANVHQYLLFIQANTSTNQQEATIKDTDDRNKKQYHMIKHFRFEHGGPVVSYGLKKVGFGIEYCKKVTMIEVNYGNQNQRSEAVEINSHKNISSLGFVTCRHCGKSSSVIYCDTTAEELHFKYCNHREVGYPEPQESRGTFERLYLYREMPTEAIKILLPVQVFDTRASLEMFKAGIERGMQHYYKSNPEHLRIETYQEFNKATNEFDNYLVMFDSIPGGTGYLSKLFDRSEFSRLLRIAYEHIRDCNCQREGKDGCYHCILSYGNQWRRENLSRERAEELFRSLVEECDNWEEVSGGVGLITGSGVIEDSELELIFVRGMQNWAKSRNWSWNRKFDAMNETYHYELIIKEDGLKIKYVVHPQYRVGPIMGVEKNSIPDFQFICSGIEKDGEDVDLELVPQISVFVDGYAYHASRENMGFYNDLERREAIRRAKGPIKRLTWTLTWEDLKRHSQVDVKEAECMKELDRHVLDGDIAEAFPSRLRFAQDSFERFIHMLKLANYSEQTDEVFGFLASCTQLNGDYLANSQDIDEAIRTNARSQFSQNLTEEEVESGDFFVKSDFIRGSSLTGGSMWIRLDEEKPTSENVRFDFKVKENLKEINRADWHDFWNRYNLLQFFDNIHSESVDKSDSLEDILLYYPDLETEVRKIYRMGFEIDIDFEGLKDDDGIITAEAEIKIKDNEIVIGDFNDNPESLEAFKKAGYEVLSILELDKLSVINKK